MEGRRVPKERAQRDSTYPTADETGLRTLRRRVWHCPGRQAAIAERAGGARSGAGGG